MRQVALLPSLAPPDPDANATLAAAHLRVNQIANVVNHMSLVLKGNPYPGMPFPTSAWWQWAVAGAFVLVWLILVVRAARRRR